MCRILTWKNSPSIEQKMQKLSTKQSFAFVHLGSFYICLPLGPRSIVMKLELCMLLLVFFIFSLRKVSGQQILERCIRIWKGFFFLRFAIHIHTLRKKIQVQRCKLVWIPKCLPTNYFIIYFQERFFYLKIFIIIIIVHQIYLFIITHARPAST